MGSVIPFQVKLLAYLAESPLPGAWFTFTFPMKTKNPYRLLFGPASPSGELTVARDEILREVKKIRDLFLMDYDDLGIGWTGVLEVRALRRSDIADLLLAYDTYGESGSYPPDLKDRLAQLDTALDGHEGEDLTVQVRVVGGEHVRISCVSQRVE